MPQLIVARHGETQGNAEHRYQGQNGTPFNATGLAQAERLAERLANESIDAILCSDLRRALQTAEPVAKRLGLEIVPDARLREVDVGEWEGLTFADIEERYPDFMADWMTDKGYTRIPGGESAFDMAQRIEDLVISLRTRPDEETILLVTHGGWIQVLLCVTLGLPYERRHQFMLRNASVTVLSLYGEHTILELFNDAHHLAPLGGSRG